MKRYEYSQLVWHRKKSEPGRFEFKLAHHPVGEFLQGGYWDAMEMLGLEGWLMCGIESREFPSRDGFEQMVYHFVREIE